MLKTPLRIIALLVCTLNAAFGQLVEDFDPAKLTWTESPAKNIWKIGPLENGMSPLYTGAVMGTRSYESYIENQDVTTSSSSFLVPTVATGEKIYMEFFSWHRLKYPESALVKLSTSDGKSSRFLKNFGYYSSDAQKWVFNSIDISDFAGKEVIISMILDMSSTSGTQVNSNYLGFFIDQIRIRKSSTAVDLDYPIVLNPINDMAVIRDQTSHSKITFAYKNANQEPVFKVALSDSALVPPDSVKLTKVSEGVYDLGIAPLKGHIGSVAVTLSTTAGLHTSSRSFKVYVNDPQVLIHETFENPDYMKWTREPSQSRWFSVGETTLVPKSDPLSPKVLGLVLNEKLPLQIQQLTKFVSNAIQLPSSENGTYLLSFKNYREVLGYYGVTTKVKIRDERGVETVLLDLQADHKLWKEELVSLPQFEGQKIQIVFEFFTQGSTSRGISSLVNGWFIDDVKLLHIGNPNPAFKPFAIAAIQDLLKLNLGAGKIPFTVMNPEGQEIHFKISSSNDAVVQDQSLAVVGEKSQYLLDYTLAAKGETSIKLVAKSPEYSDSVTFRVISPSGRNKDSLLLMSVFKQHQMEAAGYNWNTAPMRRWIGVGVSPNGRVKTLTFNRNFPMFGFPIEITQLDSLENLTLLNSGIGGTIPAEIGNLKALTSLSISGGGFKGWFPKEIGQLSKLKTFNLRENMLLPDAIGDLKALEEIVFDTQSDAFTFPKTLFKISTLKKVNINGRYGNDSPFPEGIGNLTNLESFICDCGLTGKLPEELGTLSKLKNLELYGNSLTQLPNSIGDLQNLENLYLSGNPIKTIPASIVKLKNLRFLNVSGAQLSGPVPTLLFELTSLETLNISYNLFKGPIPAGIVNLKNLKNLFMSGNEITYIPSNLHELQNLENIEVHSNYLDSIPNFSLSSKLPYIILQDNYLGFMDFERNTKIAASARTQRERPLKIWSRNIGDNISFDAQINGKNNVYQWYKNGLPMHGQTSSILTLPNLMGMDQGDYQCYVTNTVVANLTIKSNINKLFVRQPNNTLPALRDTVMSVKGDRYYMFSLGFINKDSEGDSLFYQILTTQEYFEIRYKYTLYATYDLNSYPSSDPVVLKILYYDKRGLSDTLTVTVNVLPDENPYGGSVYHYVEIPENIAAGTEIFKINFKGINDEPLTFTSSSKEIVVDPVTGRVTVAANFVPNFAIRNEYSFSINAKDKNGVHYYVYLYVTILPVRDRTYNFDPKIESQVIEIYKTVPGNSIIGKITATDFDKDTLSFQMTSVNTRFGILPNGDVKLNTSLINTTDTLYVLNVMVSDKKGGNAYGSITVRVIPKGIILTTKTLSVNENTSDNSTIGKVIAQELTGAGLKYAIDGDKSKVPFDFINENNNMLIVVDSSMLDYEKTKQFTFNILITASNGVVLSAPLTVNLNDVNEGAISVDDQLLGSLQVYPTLVSDFVHVEAKAVISHIQLINLHGKVLNDWYPNQQRYTLNVGHLDPSQYLLQIYVGQDMVQQKLIIAR